MMHTKTILIGLKSILHPLWELLMPARCPVCREPLTENESALCTKCRANLPLTGLHLSPTDSELMDIFQSNISILSAVALLYYNRDSPYTNIIKSLKYRGIKSSAESIMPLYLRLIKENNLFQDVDIVLPVPLHRRRQSERGFNQAESIAEPIAKMLGKPLDIDSIIRVINNPQQARERHISTRQHNVDSIFSISSPETLTGKHILIVDDVITTGSTILSLCDTISLAAIDCKISICSLYCVKRCILR